ncbi:diketogulonate reductase-like aldo/keto reductase [Tamaricihabitans halophyticus]|uniref:Diketogulonate reductase-like aldo/keto reductase n=1 Tax=Tamaricihabitans halophyticus TaxID=1262583 RepID=A0A4R2RCH0_9PSEU|nr:aldo/keto reductase [Tamaricihabitans halophyticus]TCP57125.1 diketogulonate reductase-like aldo/keto reductase [Tamaricihabitans halophyticus]
MSNTPTIKLGDAVEIPQLGFGVYKVPPDETEASVRAAIETGYRAIDTATLYQNEREVGAAIRASGVAREDIFVTTKLWNDAHGYDEAIRAFERSESELGLDYLDLFLIHWPVPSTDRYVETWRALLELRRSGRVRAVGVSNFEPEHLRRLVEETGVAPAINQVELHPLFQQRALRDAHDELGVVTEAWAPLARGNVLTDPMLVRLAKKYDKTPSQIVLRWHLDIGNVAIPKSVTPSRIAENFDVFDFALESDDIVEICALDDEHGRTGKHPNDM